MTLHRDAFLRGLRQALALPAWIVGVSFLGVGSLAHDVGYPAGAAVLSTLLIWAAPAQVILFGGIAAGTGLPSLALAVCLSSMRFLPMTMSILPLVRRPGQSGATQVLAAHCVAVTVWIESLRHLPTLPPEERPSHYFGLAATMILVSSLFTALGYTLVSAVPAPLAAGLLFVTPIFFTLSLTAGARRAADWAALLLGFGLAPLATLAVGKDFDLLVTGLVGGTAAYALARRRAAR